MRKPVVYAAVAVCLAAGAAVPGRSAPVAPAVRESVLQQQILEAQSRVLPALVHVQPISEVSTGGQTRRETGVGSGVIIDAAGTIVTNYHVVGKEATRIFCTLASKERVGADLIGGDPYTDIAVIRLKADDLKHDAPYAVLGRSADLQEGEFVIALGSPMSLSRSITHGIISCRDRFLGVDGRLPGGEQTGNFNTWIQTDAAINFGNSGGPLVNLQGEVIGINSRRGSVFADNLGFAIPIDVVREVVDQILRDGRVVRSTIGIDLQPLQELEDFFGFDAPAGALIAGIAPNSPAERGGLRVGDILLRFGGTETAARYAEQIPAVYKTIADTPVGETVAVEAYRLGQRVSLEVVTQELGESVGEEFGAADWGFTVRAITEQDARDRRLEDRTGVLVSSKSAEERSQLRWLSPGDVIRAINGEDVASLERFREIYADLSGSAAVLLKIRRASMTRFVALYPETGAPHAE